MALASSSTQVDHDRAYSEAATLYKQGDLAGAWAGFEELVDSPWWAGQARYGLGLICLRTDHRYDARRWMAAALEMQPFPSAAEAAYNLGRLAEQDRDLQEARRLFEQALKIAPGHQDARVALESVSSPTDPAIASIEEAGLHALLLQDQLPISKDSSAAAIQVMRQLRMRRRPYASAYLGLAVTWTLVLYMGLVVIHAAPVVLSWLTQLVTLGQITFAGDSALLDNVNRLAGFVVWPGLMALIYVRARTTIFTIANGRLQVESGIFLRKQNAYELWNVGALGLQRSVFNYITGDGTLIFHLRPERQSRQGLFARVRRAVLRCLGEGTEDQVMVRGLAKAPELKVIYNRLESLRVLLRVNNYIKGIISG